MTRYFIALGSNVGDRLGHLSGAVRGLGEAVRVLGASSMYETEPVGGPDQDPYLNAVVAVETGLEPLPLLDLLQEIESEHGRERTVEWGPRTLDLDIVAWDGPALSGDRLVVPHPRAAQRAFVLEPLAENWPDAVVGDGVTAIQALRGVDRSGVDFLAEDWIPPVSRIRPNLLVTGQMLILGLVALGIFLSGDIPAGLTVSAVVGALATIAGLGFMLVSARLLGPAITASPVPAAGARLVEWGPYRLVRHPIYTGVCLTVLGAAILFESLPALITALALIPYLWFKTLYEERQLRMHFVGYRAYQARVRWRLIPYVT